MVLLDVCLSFSSGDECCRVKNSMYSSTNNHNTNYLGCSGGGGLAVSFLAFSGPDPANY